MAADSPSAGSFLPGLDMLQDMLAKAGASALLAAGIMKTVIFIFVSPLLGFLLERIR